MSRTSLFLRFRCHFDRQSPSQQLPKRLSRLRRVRTKSGWHKFWMDWSDRNSETTLSSFQSISLEYLPIWKEVVPKLHAWLVKLQCGFLVDLPTAQARLLGWGGFTTEVGVVPGGCRGVGRRTRCCEPRGAVSSVEGQGITCSCSTQFRCWVSGAF